VGKRETDDKDWVSVSMLNVRLLSLPHEGTTGQKNVGDETRVNKNNLHIKKQCKNFRDGNCSFGFRCHFSHIRQLSMQSSVSHGGVRISGTADPTPRGPSSRLMIMPRRETLHFT